MVILENSEVVWTGLLHINGGSIGLEKCTLLERDFSGWEKAVLLQIAIGDVTLGS